MRQNDGAARTSARKGGEPASPPKPGESA